ncbi:hypothetical protein ANTQUA_LOCUS10430 [Anthophora quadrimaculata]
MFFSACNRCNIEHAKGQCSTPEDTEKENLYCNNCNSKGHPATYRGCQYIKERVALNKIKQKQIQKDSKPTQQDTESILLNTITKEINKRNTSRNHMTYSQILQSNTPTSTNNNNTRHKATIPSTTPTQTAHTAAHSETFTNTKEQYLPEQNSSQLAGAIAALAVLDCY